MNEVGIGLAVPGFGVEIARQRLAPAHFNRCLLTGELLGPAEALTAGFFDRIVPASELDMAAHQAADSLSRINLAAHVATKMRVRSQATQAIRAAIDPEITLEDAERRVTARSSAGA